MARRPSAMVRARTARSVAGSVSRAAPPRGTARRRSRAGNRRRSGTSIAGRARDRATNPAASAPAIAPSGVGGCRRAPPRARLRRAGGRAAASASGNVAPSASVIGSSSRPTRERLARRPPGRRPTAGSATCAATDERQARRRVPRGAARRDRGDARASPRARPPAARPAAPAARRRADPIASPLMNAAAIVANA